MSGNGIAVVGKIAEQADLYDGQAVKTRILCEELIRHYPDRTIYTVDTYQYKKNVFTILKNTFRAFFHCQTIIVLLAKNGRTFLVPFLMFLNLFFHRQLYHDVIGGSMPSEVANHPFLIRCMSGFRETWVETASMKKALYLLGIKRVKVLPNFKRLPIIKESEIGIRNKKTYIFVTFSRVLKEKGITDAIHAVTALNEKYGAGTAILHVYGQIEREYVQEFQSLLQQYPFDVEYKGIAHPGQSVSILRHGFMLLFPSVYPGEGIPGTIIDAFAAGLPVIATNWHFNAEMVDHGVTGYVYSWEHSNLLFEWMCYAIEHSTQVDDMRTACLKEAEKYTPDAVMPYIFKKIEE